MITWLGVSFALPAKFSALYASAQAAATATTMTFGIEEENMHLQQQVQVRFMLLIDVLPAVHLCDISIWLCTM